MKPFSERNPYAIAAAAVVLIALLIAIPLTYDKMPFIRTGKTYSAYFAEAGGIKPGSAVQVAGYQVGKVSSVKLDGPRVLIKFDVDKTIRLGARTGAAVKTKSLLGSKVLEVYPAGDGGPNGPIALERTTSAYQLPDALGDLSATISGLDTTQLSDAWRELSQTFQDTPPDLKQAVDGVGRLSASLNDRDAELRRLLRNANQVTGVLAKRVDQVVALIADSNQLLVQLQSQSAALDQISTNVSALSRELRAFIATNGSQLRPALDKLNGVLAIVDNRKEDVQKSIKMLNSFAMSLGEAVASGPFFKVYLANLLPGQFVQPFIDAAFSDLGLDPNVLLPSQLNEPQVGQRATPALPLPYPRTGQGGEPNLTVPDAITGSPGDSRYPYDPPLPAPPPGGPPPGPPAGLPPGPPVGLPTVASPPS